jgi:hypothetical protein
MLFNYDWRLQINDHASQEYRKAQDERRRRTRTELGEPHWQSVINVFCDLVIEKAGLITLTEHKIDIPRDNMDLWEKAHELEVFITDVNDQGLPDLQSPLTQALCECIGERLAQVMECGFVEWKRIHSIIYEYWPMYEAWVNNLSKDEVLKHEAEIFELPPYDHVLDLVQRWTLHLDSRYWDEYVERMKALETLESGPELWLAMKRLTIHDTSIELIPDLTFRGRLMQRIGLRQWVNWVLNLPLVSMQYSVLQQVGNIDKAMEICTLTLSPNFELNTHLCQKIMAIQALMGILESIDGQLDRWSSDRLYDRDTKFRQNIEGEAKHWREVELPLQLQRIAELVIQTSETNRVPLCSTILTGVYQFNIQKDRCEAAFRDQVVREIGKCKDVIPHLIDNILGHASKPGLLSSSAIIFQNILSDNETLEIVCKVWNSFTSLVSKPEFHWGNLYGSDDGLLAWNMAGLLTNLPENVTLYAEVLKSLSPESEGWNFNVGRYFANQRQVVFYLIVGSMASEWLMAATPKPTEDATTLFRSVWQQAHRWIRWTRSDLQENSILVAELWARMSSVFSPDQVEQEAMGGLELLDELEHVITACNVLAMNYHGPGNAGALPDSLRAYVRKTVDEQLPILIAMGRTKGEVIKWYQDVTAKLTSPSNI